jgi:t-SNARE complex subunit (syntaxin)
MAKPKTETEKERARRRFMAVNPQASVRDFERLWPQIRDRQLIENFNQGRVGPTETKRG